MGGSWADFGSQVGDANVASRLVAGGLYPSLDAGVSYLSLNDEELARRLQQELNDDGAAAGPSSCPSQPMPAGSASPAWPTAASCPDAPVGGKNPSAPPLVPDEETCVICLSAPQEAGFLHGSTVHRCCCRDCAKQLHESGVNLCPMCREPIDQVIMAVY